MNEQQKRQYRVTLVDAIAKEAATLKMDGPKICSHYTSAECADIIAKDDKNRDATFERIIHLRDELREVLPEGMNLYQYLGYVKGVPAESVGPEVMAKKRPAKRRRIAIY